jgi:hypothetical protein
MSGTVPDFNQVFGDGHGEVIKFKRTNLQSYTYGDYQYWVK